MSGVIQKLKAVYKTYSDTNLIVRVFIGLVIGLILGLVFKNAGWIGIFGSLFVSSLKALAPLLVFVLVISSIAQGKTGFDSRFGFVIFEYLFSTFSAAIVAVVFCFLFPVKLTLNGQMADTGNVLSGIDEVFVNLLEGMVSNPISGIVNANYISVLFWAVVFGAIMRKMGSDSTRALFKDLSDIVSAAVRGVINLAPFGIMGLVYISVSTNGLDIFKDYSSLILLLVVTVLVVALVLNPLIVFLILKKNPYPLIFICLKESGITAFFTRSSAANIPVNMSLCERLGLDKNLYSVSIPLGSTINMDGAAVVITILTLSTVHTLGIPVDLPSAILLSIISTIAASGTSGVAGGSLMLIPMSCALFGISSDISMQVIGIGFIISIIQDSLETALNSSGDVIFTATAEYRNWIKKGKSLPTFLGGTTKVGI